MLPPLPCPNKKWQYCNLCSFDVFDCFRREIASFVNPVKESLFFTNKYVPESIRRENLRNPIYSFDKRCENTTTYISGFPASKDNTNTLQCEPCVSNKTVCILQKGRKEQSYVFKLLSIDSFVCYNHSCDEMLVIAKRPLLISTARYSQWECLLQVVFSQDIIIIITQYWPTDTNHCTCRVCVSGSIPIICSQQTGLSF